jgi:beta-glucanase (GH16 family)
VCASLLAAGALTGGALGAVPAAQASRAAVVVARRVGKPGLYAVTVIVTGRSTSSNRVTVLIGGLRRTVHTRRHHRRARIHVRVRIAGRVLMVRAIGRRARPRPRVIVRARLLKAKPAPPATPAPAAPAPPAPPAPAPPAPPQPPGPGSPYTTLVWSDDFTTDWANAGGGGTAQEPIPPTWRLDNWGGCGTSPPQLSQNTGAAGSAYLTSQGLALPVVATGPSSYRTAQLDTAAIAGESWQYGTIEASIQLPTGQGLCPAFWMLPDSGAGEIDVLEAPSYVGASYGPLAPYAVFTLHAGNTQQFEAWTPPVAWNPGQPNVYGLIWTPTSITWTVNYVAYATATPSSLSNPALWSAFTSGKFHLLLDVAVGGWPGDPPAGTVYTQPMTVQWVKVFQ